MFKPDKKGVKRLGTNYTFSGCSKNNLVTHAGLIK